MKILALTQDSNFNGGANRSFYMVISSLVKQNVQIEVLLPGHGELEEKFKKDGVKTYIYPFKGVISAYRDDGKDWIRKIKVPIMYNWEKSLGSYLAKKLKNEKFDLVYTNTRLPYVGAVIAKKLKIPHIVHIREFGTAKAIWGKWSYEKIYEESSKIILISKALYDKVKEYVPEDKLVMIHNGIESDLNLKVHKILENKNVNLILTGRIVPDKGHGDAIKELKILKDKGFDNIYLNIVGSYPKSGSLNWYYKKINQEIIENNLEKNVIFHGEVKNMTEIRKNMDIELMCSICETFGRVTVEGMRNGLLVIGSNTGGTPEIIKDKYNGLLYEQGKPQDLAEKILSSINNKDEARKIAENAYQFSQTNFTPESNTKQIYEVIKEVLNENEVKKNENKI